MEDCLPFHSWNLPFHSGIFHSEIFVPFHSIPCPGCRFYIIITIVTFYLTVVARLKIRKRQILKKLLPLPAPFQHFRFRFQPLSSKCFRFHKKLIASTAALPHPWLIQRLHLMLLLIWIDLLIEYFHSRFSANIVWFAPKLLTWLF